MSRPVVLQARYFFPVDGPPRRDALLVLKGHCIDSFVTSVPAGCQLVDLGDVAVMPGLVNAHTHLEFSCLESPLGEPGMSLIEWLPEVLRYRTETEHDPESPTAVERGIAESLRHGTTSLGEIATADWPQDSQFAMRLDLTVFRELIAPTADQARIASNVATAESHVSTGRDAPWQAGLSPHAPYTVHPQLWQELTHSESLSSVPWAMHLAESPEEMEWLRSGSGPLAELMAPWGISGSPWSSHRPLSFVDSLAQLPKALCVHGNYLDSAEISRLGELAESVSVVYCPRTHSFFQHDAYPLEAMQQAGVNVALGTDGRCSNPDLSLLAEMRHVAAKHPQVALESILSMGTRGGARALGRDHVVGSLAPGKHANLAVVALPAGDAEDPHELLLRHEGQVVATIYRGGLAHAADPSLSESWPSL